MQPKVKEQKKLKEITLEKKSLILFDDDFNTFDFVINCLVEICNHTLEQAEQCTYLVHYKGKCCVKTGVKEKLTPLCDALLKKGLKAKIQ